jgi:hypothetical protein
VATDAIPPVTETERQLLSHAAQRALSPGIPPGTRPERVLAALRHFASAGGFVCQTTGTLAHWLGVSAETVRRGIADLLRLGSIERTGLRQGKAVQYRIVESPQPLVESPQPSAAPQPATAGIPTGESLRDVSVGEDSCGDDHNTISPMAVEDREHLDNFEWTPELRTEYAGRARALALRYSDQLETEYEEVGQGECGDCRGQVAWRGRYGKFKVCRPCLATREAVATKLEASA